METKKICRAEEACKMLSICRSSLFKSSIEAFLEKNAVHPGENND